MWKYDQNKQKNLIHFVYEQGKIFKKSNKDTKFKNLLEQFRINRGTIIFKINIAKLADKYPKMLTSSATLIITKTLKSFVKKI